MKTKIPMTVLASILALATTTIEPGHASPQPGPPLGVFPPHAHVRISLRVSNAFIDCYWSFSACDAFTGRPDMSEPDAHVHTMDHLHRLRGWEEVGTTPSTMSFINWRNVFSSAASSSATCRDMATAERDTGFPEKVLVAGGVSGARGWIVYHFGGSTMSLICAWKGAIEVESGSSWETGNTKEGRIARRFQSEQISAALGTA